VGVLGRVARISQLIDGRGTIHLADAAVGRSSVKPQASTSTLFTAFRAADADRIPGYWLPLRKA
jgi:hypothetical protein